MDPKNFKVKFEDGFIEIPFDVKKLFGQARPPVKVSINKHSYRSTVSVYGGKYFIPVRKSNQEAAGIKAGDMVKAAIEADTELRTVEPPAELVASFRKNAKAKAGWEKLSYTFKKEYADAILQAKKPETRARRLEKILQQLEAKAEKA